MSEPICRLFDRARSLAGALGPAIKASSDVHVNGLPVLRRCDAGINQMGPCAFAQWKAIEGSVSVSVNGKPVVRRGDKTQHFSCGTGAMIEGSPTVFVGGVGVTAVPVSLDDVVGYIYGEMMRNIEDPRVEEILAYNNRYRASLGLLPEGQEGSFWARWGAAVAAGGSPSPDFYSLTQALQGWRDLVATGATWDHKSHILSNYGEWAYDSASDISIQYENFSNVHYGFVGRRAGFDEQTLLDGAGLAQYLDHDESASKLKGYAMFALGETAKYDELEDSSAIEVGMDLWDKWVEEGELSPEDVKAALLESMADLKAVIGVVC